MNATIDMTWAEANQRALTAALERLRAQLSADDEGEEAGDAPAEVSMTEPPAFDQLAATFGLSPFERDVVLLCAGVELEAAFAARVAEVGGTAGPTFGLALAALSDAHWSALTPSAPLRYWRLVHLGSGDTLATSPLRLDERVLHFLTGVDALDEQLEGFVQPVAPPAGLVPSHRAVAEQIRAAWASADVALPAVRLNGSDPVASLSVAAAACAALGLPLYRLDAASIPNAPTDADLLARLWTREAALRRAALFLDADGLDADDARRRAVRFVDAVGGPVLFTGEIVLRRPVLVFDVPRPRRAEQQAWWAAALGPAGEQLNGQLGEITAQYDLPTAAIEAASLRGLALADGGVPLPDALRTACRSQARQRTDGLAHRIEPAATWDDLVLPEPQQQLLRDLAMHARQRVRVHETWGFAARSSRGLGITALFAGPSGTGKTLAAEVVAHTLGLDLLHVDLSRVVSKYIGETEKNLGRVFDAAEAGGVVLLFDEADALFGKRSEVKDSHDRYANLEVSYLLQRMEAYRGLAILTTNLKKSLDDAFQRRLRFVVPFPLPDAAHRAAIWQRAFPPETPTEGLDVAALARLNATGGTIRNIALHAAFLAADADEPVRMTHLLAAARRVYAKNETTLTDHELRGWA